MLFEKAALSVNGVIAAVWNAGTGKIAVIYDDGKIDQATIQKAIAKVGHDTELFKADDVTYRSLPECCTYRK